MYQTVAFRRLRRCVLERTAGTHENTASSHSNGLAPLPFVSLILPCKGLDIEFEASMQKLLRQNYHDPVTGAPAFEIIFAVADEQDPAYAELQKITASASGVLAKLVVAPPCPQTRAQKINNQLAALQHIDPRCEILVFADSDATTRENFLHNLTAPLLQDDNIGVTTGYRFYNGHRLSNFACILRALWNRMSAWEMADPKFAFAWGGAMAVKLSTFRAAQTVQSWERTADDDLALTTAIHKLNRTVYFVPQCLVTTKSDEGWREVVEWMNRQLILTKVYFRPLWLKAIGKAAVMAAWLLLLPFVIAACYVCSNWYSACLLIIFLAVVPVELSFLILGNQLWAPLLSADKDAAVGSEKIDSGWRWRELLPVLLALPLGHLILPWLTLYSIGTNRIRWRGVSYELRAADDVRVIL